jgi:ArsR family transcriptional regulator
MVELDQFADIFKLLGDKNRLHIMALMKERELCVCELVDLLDTSQPNISQHIRKLKDAQLIKETRRGQWIYYSLSLENKPHVQSILALLPGQEDKLKSFIPVDCC